MWTLLDQGGGRKGRRHKISLCYSPGVIRATEVMNHISQDHFAVSRVGHLGRPRQLQTNIS